MNRNRNRAAPEALRTTEQPAGDIAAPRANRKPPKPLIGRPTFNVKNVCANNRELGVWFALMSVGRTLVTQRTVLATRFHEALGFDKEAAPLEPYHRRGMRIVDRAWGEGRGIEQNNTMLEAHLRDVADYGFFVTATSRGAAQSLVYSIDSLIKFAATHAKIENGKGDANLIGGRYLTPGITLLEGFRVIANWQRHHLEWDDAPFNESNFNHRALKEMSLWHNENVPVGFLKLLKRRSYFQLERDILGALEYLVCEVGMRYPKT